MHKITSYTSIKRKIRKGSREWLKSMLKTNKNDKTCSMDLYVYQKLKAGCSVRLHKPSLEL